MNTPITDAPMPSIRQHTLARTVQWRGEVRRGQRAALTLHPAAPDSGVRLQRAGVLPEHALIEARWDAVIDIEPRLVLANAHGVSVRGASTLLAALRALGLDNVLVEIDGRELPEGVASFCSYLETLADAGLQPQAVPRQALRVDATVEVRDSFGFAAATPAPGFCLRLGVASADRSGETLLVSGALASDLLEPAHGPGPDPEEGAAPLSETARPLWDPRALPPLLRTRMIDTLGHLSLAGAPLIGHVRSYRASPALHHALLRALLLRHAATRVTVDAFRSSPLARRAGEETSPLASSGPGYFH